MGEIEKSKAESRKTSYWGEWKEFWVERFSFLDNYSRFLNPEKPLPRHWDSSDVEQFVASDPIYGPTLKTTREVAKFGAAGAVVGAVSTAGIAWKYSKSPHGAVLSFAFGAVVGSTFGLEIGSHFHQLYRLDPMASQVKFFEWLQNKAERESKH
ncbi:hypothetical protein RD792_009928 [Penstemon davidsonii]|uniref:Succinate dehydrogenase subunit 6, mitochondrial n=1 Tax=Penstemon davidsonii TaxID=160366 RepID=A0ABR0D0E9_9LAMI|nr:hypothetical protein RD792_009928 [Penstemon davidsonii]